MARLPPGAVIVFVILFFLFVSPSNQPTSIAQLVAIRTAVAKERVNLQVLETSSANEFAQEDTFWLNLTGLRDGDGFKGYLLPRVRERARAQVVQAIGNDGLDVVDGRSNLSLAIYHNVSSWLDGQWVRSEVEEDLSTPNVNLSAIVPDAIYYSQDYGRNITGSKGRVRVRLNDKPDTLHGISKGVMQSLTARITIQDETSFSDGWTTALFGVHHRDSGSILLTTTSEKFAGIFALPHFSLSASFFELAKVHLNATLSKAIDDQADDPGNSSENPWTSITSEEEASISPMCELVVYLQQHAIPRSSYSHGASSGALLSSLDEIEQELRFPTGRPVPSTPRIQMSMLIFSPDCGFILESKGLPDHVVNDKNHLDGPKLEIFVATAKNVLLLFMLIVTGQLLLLVDQMKISLTPSTRSRISFYTITMMSLGTGFAAFAFLFLSSFLVSMYLTSLTAAFLLFLEGNFFGMKFLMDIWTAQEPERIERRRRRQQRISVVAVTPNELALPASALTSEVPTSAAAIPASSDNIVVPLAMTAPRPLITNGTALAQAVPTTNAIPPPITPERPTTFGAIYTRYCLLLLSIIFFSIHAATSWPIAARSFYANTLVLLYLSFWVPQIYRNIMRSCRKPFKFAFIIGQSVLRLAPFAYLWCIEDNVMFIDTDRRMFCMFVLWMFFQVCILLGQEILGPRWCVSEKWSWVPIAWNYHPILKEDEESATLPIGITRRGASDDETNHSASSPLLSSRRLSRSSRNSIDESSSGAARSSKTSNTRTFDCAICMQRREVPMLSTSGASNENNNDTNILATGTGLGSRLLLERRRRDYMVTPCRHIFDTKCLEGWMGYKLQCPTCRETLPPL